MTDIRAKLKNIAGGERRRAVITAGALIALALAMFFVALFAPFRYFSDKDVLHIVYETSEEGEDGESSGGEAVAEYNEIKHVRQSLFMLFEATTMLGDASALHAASFGEIYDEEDYENARKRLTELRDEYNKIVTDTRAQAQKEKIAEGSDDYNDLLAANLSEMNLMALDMLETAFESDNAGAYEAVFGGVVLGLINGIINLLIATTAIVAVTIAILRIFGKGKRPALSLFFSLFTSISALGLLMCVFNPVIPPAACPLALCVISVAVYFCMGLARALVGATPLHTVIKNAVCAALVPTAMLCLAAKPSLTLYVNVTAGHDLYYPGTVGTVMYSRVEAIKKIGLGIPDGALKAAFVLGIAACIFAAIATTVSLDRQYRGTKSRGAVYSALLLVTTAVTVMLAIWISASGSNLKTAGISAGYTAGACWYILIAFTAVAAATSIAFSSIARSRAKNSAQSAVPDGLPQAEDAENISAPVDDVSTAPVDAQANDGAEQDGARE